jgi:hypothetical protein
MIAGVDVGFSLVIRPCWRICSHQAAFRPAARLLPGGRPAFRPAARLLPGCPPSARLPACLPPGAALRCAAMIASYARHALIAATMSGTTGDHPQRAQRKRPPRQRIHDRCSDRCRCLKEKPAIRYIDHCTLEGEQPCMITAGAEQASNRARSPQEPSSRAGEHDHRSGIG